MSILSKLRVVDPVLTNIAQGYQQAELVGTKLFPLVIVTKEAGKYVIFGKEAFRLYDSARAIRSDAKRINVDVDEGDYILTEHTLEGLVDDREIEEAAEVIDPEKHLTMTLEGALQTRLEVNIATIATTAGNYSGSNKITKSGNSRWSETTATIIADIEAGKEAIRAKIGRYPNTALMGASVYSMVKEHDDFLGRIKYAQKGIVTPELIAEIINVPNVHVGTAVKASGNTFSDIWGRFFVLAWVPPAPAKNVPAFGYTFQKKGQPRVYKYREERAESEVIHVSDIFQPNQTGADAGYLITIADA